MFLLGRDICLIFTHHTRCALPCGDMVVAIVFPSATICTIATSTGFENSRSFPTSIKFAGLTLSRRGEPLAILDVEGAPWHGWHQSLIGPRETSDWPFRRAVSLWSHPSHDVSSTLGSLCDRMFGPGCDRVSSDLSSCREATESLPVGVFVCSGVNCRYAPHIASVGTAADGWRSRSSQSSWS